MTHAVPGAQQTLPQTGRPSGHSPTQAPFMHLEPFGQQTLPQMVSPLGQAQTFPAAAVARQTKPGGQQMLPHMTWPAGHGLTQAPFTQFVPAGQQTLPQMARPSGHVLVQTPLSQCVPDGQTVPQAPQLALSVLILTQTGANVPHRTVPLGQPHLPSTQSWPAGQIVPHAPQFALSWLRLPQTVPHNVCPLGQPPQWPWTQCSPRRQRWPQLPQLRTSLARLVHLPWQQAPWQQTKAAAVSPHRSLLLGQCRQTLWQCSRLSSPWNRLQYSWQALRRSAASSALSLFPKPNQDMQLAPKTPPSRQIACRREIPLARDLATSSNGLIMRDPFLR